jgi:hypothetical protein
MGESKLTKTLKMASMLFLKNQLCDEIATEVKIYPTRLVLNPMDKHYTIDVCGIGVKYRHSQNPNESMIKEPITRGIEIKISRGDFRNGFIHSGCNYNYLLFPKGLVSRDEVESSVGLIEYDDETFSVKKGVLGKYYFNGFKIIRSPRYKVTSDREFSYLRGQIGYCATNQMLRWARDQLQNKRGKIVEQY